MARRQHRPAVQVPFFALGWKTKRARSQGWKRKGLKRCPAEGRQRFALWVGAAVLANNLMKGVRN
jgi:hypothetical protein